MNWLLSFVFSFTAVWLEAAPWFLLGLGVAGLIHGLIPAAQLARLLGGNPLWASTKAAIIGTPLPLCSCSVLPAAIALRKQGASKPATVSFLVSTPENGADSIALSYALLGPGFAIARPIAAVISAIVAGTLTGFLTIDTPTTTTSTTTTPNSDAQDSVNQDSVKQDSVNKESAPKAPTAEPQTSCCSSTPTPKPATQACCSAPSQAATTQTPTLLNRLTQAIGYGYGSMLQDLVKWLLIGLVLAALINTFVDPGTLASWGAHPLAYLIMLVIGVPMYICATASTPIAASLLIAGVSPGAVLIFLLAGPATNIAGIAVVQKQMGTKTTIAYLTGVGVVALLAAWLVDQTTWLNSAAQTAHEHAHEHNSWFAIACGVVLAGLTIKALYHNLNLNLRREHQPTSCCSSTATQTSDQSTAASCCNNNPTTNTTTTAPPQIPPPSALPENGASSGCCCKS